MTVKWSKSSVSFQTAWAGVPKLIESVSKEFPSLEFYYEWADEDTGCNVGRGKIINGMSDVQKLKNESLEAYELALKLNPEQNEYYKLVEGKYEYIEED